MTSVVEHLRALAEPTLLDGSYVDFVSKLQAHKCFVYGSHEWTAFDLKSLDEPYRLGKKGTLFSFSRATAAHAELLNTIGVDVTDDTESPFGSDRLAMGFCIGEDNGAPIFIDPDSNGVFVYYGDGMYVKQWAMSVSEFVSNSRPRHE